jgi:succinoglycan biosynthesis protein ExoV
VKLYLWRGAARNFGDELNLVLWPRLLPGWFDEDDTEWFLGIGSVLDSRHPADRLKIVAGAGYGGYRAPPVLDGTWRIHWVRGPLTARRLGLSEELGLGDPASLLGSAMLGSPMLDPATSTTESGGAVGFMPHFESAAAGDWRAVAAGAGVNLIDPRDDPLVVLAAIGGCRVLLSEALHGVIAADALRVPWIAIEPLAAIHRAKWQDWAATLDLNIAFRRLPAASLLEVAEVSWLTRWHTTRGVLANAGDALRGAAAGWFIERAARALRRAADATAQLSADAALRRCQARMTACVERLAATRD